LAQFCVQSLYQLVYTQSWYLAVDVQLCIHTTDTVCEHFVLYDVFSYPLRCCRFYASFFEWIIVFQCLEIIMPQNYGCISVTCV